MLEMEKVGFNDINDGDGSSSNVVEVYICKNRRWVGKREYYIFFRFFYIWIIFEGDGGYYRRRIFFFS